MQCPKCKNYINDDALRCPHCNLKVRIVCPKCKTINLMGKKPCKKCGFKFFTVCPHCQTINLSTADTCRKCKKSLIEKEDVIQTTNVEPINEVSEQAVENQLEAQLETEQPTPQNEVQAQETEEEPQVEEVSIESVSDDNFIESSDNIDISTEQLQGIIEKVEEFDKNAEKKQEAEKIVQQKFEQQQELDEEIIEEIPPEYMQLDQASAQNAIIEAIQNPLKRIIALCGKEGSGKSLILKYIYNALAQENYIWAFGECNALTQITPFGYIQDVLLNLFNVSNFTANVEEFINSNEKALAAQFYNLNPQEIKDLINFLYPHEEAEFNGILKRKEYTINILKKVFETMTMKSMIIFVIDDFENLDGASFDFIKEIIADAKLNDKIKVLVTNKYNKIAQGYFYNKDLKSNNYANIFLSNLDDEQSISLINTLFGAEVHLPESIQTQICENAKGSSAYIEQVCLLLNEIGAFYFTENRTVEFNPQFETYELPHNIYKILEERLNAVEKEHQILITTLYYASLLGNKFSINQLENILKITQEDFGSICNFLINTNYFVVLSDNYLTFKNTLVWHYIYERAKTEDNFKEFNRQVFEVVEPLTLSNNSLKPLLLQNCDNKRVAFETWKQNSKIASYLGDTNLYVISLKQQLKLADEVTEAILPPERIHIFEQMGKILYKISPKEATNYLSAAIAYYKEEANYNPVRVVELASFLIQSCSKQADFLGVIETCDTALSVLDSNDYNIEKALIGSKKLNALLYLGNCEEVINIANTELLEVMENSLAKPNSSKIVDDTVIFNNWVDTTLNLATAYAIQGDKKAFDVLSRIDDALLSNKIENEQYTRKILLTKALAYTIRGEAKLSSEILTTITSQYSADTMEEPYILRWNFINIMNKIISKDYQNLVDEMFQVTTFADNIDDLFTKNILKLMLGYIIQTKSKNLNKAIDIYNEESVFFSNEKIATGALLSWYLIANASLSTKGVDFALDIAFKALDVAKGPKINNYTFIIALKQLIAELYMIKNDFDSVKMYLEKAMMIAKRFDLRHQQMILYKTFAQYNSELINVYKDSQQEYANAAADMYKTAIDIAAKLSLSKQEASLKRDLTTLKASCQLKNIEITIAED